MAIKHADYDGEPGISKRLWGSDCNKEHVQVEFDHIVNCDDIGGDNDGFSKEMRGVLWRGLP